MKKESNNISEILELEKELRQLKENDPESYYIIIKLVKKLRQIG